MTKPLQKLSLVKPFYSPCPPECGLAADHTDGEVSPGRELRIHTGSPTFGKFLAGFSQDYSDDQGNLHHLVEVCVGDDGEDLGPEELRELASDAIAAAEWLETVR